VFEGLRPDIIQVRPASRETRRIVTPSGRLDRIGPEDLKTGSANRRYQDLR
jgi:hypothetical protein